jgi:hypothetical protein
MQTLRRRRHDEMKDDLAPERALPDGLDEGEVHGGSVRHEQNAGGRHTGSPCVDCHDLS